MLLKDTKRGKKMNVERFLNMLAELYGKANNVKVEFHIRKKGASEK